SEPSATIRAGERDRITGVLVMMLHSLAVAALMVTGSGVVCAQSVYLYVAPGASVYVTPTPNGYGAPTVYEGAYPGPYAPPAPIVAASMREGGAAAGPGAIWPVAGGRTLDVLVRRVRLGRPECE